MATQVPLRPPRLITIQALYHLQAVMFPDHDIYGALVPVSFTVTSK
jgi:hypothetical protein